MYGNQYFPQYGQMPQYQQGYYLPNNGAMPDQLAQLRAAQNQPVQPQGGAIVQSPITWVQGEAGAKSYLVAPGNTMMLMDSEANVFYVKSADASGVPMPLRIFDYKERTAEAIPQTQTVQPAFDPAKYITREEFEEFRAAMSAPAPKKTAKAAEVSDGE